SLPEDEERLVAAREGLHVGLRHRHAPLGAAPRGRQRPRDAAHGRWCPVSALEAIAAYAAEYGTDTGGHYLRSALVAALVADRHLVAPVQAVELARFEPYHPRVEDAAREADRLIEV